MRQRYVSKNGLRQALGDAQASLRREEKSRSDWAKRAIEVAEERNRLSLKVSKYQSGAHLNLEQAQDLVDSLVLIFPGLKDMISVGVHYGLYTIDFSKVSKAAELLRKDIGHAAAREWLATMQGKAPKKPKE